MLKYYRRWREKKLAAQQEKERIEEENRRLLKEKQEKCGLTGHEWKSSHKVQGDGDPNVEGYVLITRRTCWICGKTEVDIEPYGDDDE